MKKLNKLQINPEKVMKNEELINIKGGETYRCFCSGYDNYFNMSAYNMDNALLGLSSICPGSGGCF